MSKGNRKATIQRLRRIAHRLLFGYNEPCPECHGETHYENRGENLAVWIFCPTCDWSQLRV